MDLTRLTRKHGVNVPPGFPCSVEDRSLAVGEMVGHGMNNAVVMFMDSVDKANMVVEKGIVVNETFVPVLPLATPATRVTVSNVTPFIRDEMLTRELSRHGVVVSPINKVSSGLKSPLLRHVVSHTRTLYTEQHSFSMSRKRKLQSPQHSEHKPDYCTAWGKASWNPGSLSPG